MGFLRLLLILVSLFSIYTLTDDDDYVCHRNEIITLDDGTLPRVRANGTDLANCHYESRGPCIRVRSSWAECCCKKARDAVYSIEAGGVRFLLNCSNAMEDETTQLSTFDINIILVIIIGLLVIAMVASNAGWILYHCKTRCNKLRNILLRKRTEQPSDELEQVPYAGSNKPDPGQLGQQPNDPSINSGELIQNPKLEVPPGRSGDHALPDRLKSLSDMESFGHDAVERTKDSENFVSTEKQEETQPIQSSYEMLNYNANLFLQNDADEEV